MFHGQYFVRDYDQITNDQEESLIRDYPIVFVSNESARLFRKYRIKVRQFGLSDEAYFYHNQLKEITSQTGSIFDKQPFSLFGNIRNVEDPSEMVMGYFIVSGVSTRTITIISSDLPRNIEPRWRHTGSVVQKPTTWL